MSALEQDFQPRIASIFESSRMNPDPLHNKSGHNLYEFRQAFAIANANRDTAYAEKEAAARQCDEFRLFLQQSELNLENATWKVKFAEEQANNLVAIYGLPGVSMGAFNPFARSASLEARVHNWSSEVAVATWDICPPCAAVELKGTAVALPFSDDHAVQMGGGRTAEQEAHQME